MAVPLICASTLSTQLIASTPFYIASDGPQSDTFSMKQLDSSEKGEFQEKLWYRDQHLHAAEEICFVHVTNILAQGRSPFQEYVIIDTEDFGKVLFIDGESQSSQFDEHIYHESFVHPAMVAHPCPKSVLVIGAGEGASAREILKHPSVERLVLVDIDNDIIQAVKQYLPEWHQGAFEHPKTELLIMDGKEFVEKTDEKFDLIYLDVCDKLIIDSPATDLYTAKFYTSVKNILAENGILVVQAMELFPDPEDHFSVVRNLKEVFPHVHIGGMFIPAFYSIWGFAIATESPVLTQLTPDTIESILDERNLSNQLNHYDGETHRLMFSLPKGVRKALQQNCS